VAAQVVAFAVADIAGDEQHRELAILGLLQVADELGAGHLGHDHVADDEVERPGFEQFDRFRAARAGNRVIIQVLERSDSCGANARVILDQQYLGARDMGVGLAAVADRVKLDRCRGGSLGARQVD